MSSRDLDSVSAASASPDAAPPGGVLSPRYRWTSIGMCLLITLAAFEALAVTTIMPTVSRELDGAALYAFAFAGPLAVSVVGMVAAGAWSDRGSPRGALIASVVLFAAGLLIAGTAPTMGVFVAGRLVHGLGGGALTVVLYVIVARVYPPVLHGRIFAGFAAAWVIPSLIGPFIAGLLSETVGWRWVFLGVVALVALAMLMVVPVMRGVLPAGEGGPFRVGRLLWALLLAASVLALTLAAETSGPVQWIVPVAAAVVAALAIRPLIPTGTLLARRGLPSVILMRAVIAGTFFASEVYVPLIMVTQYGLSAAIAGLALTAAGLTWSAGSWVQGRFPGIGNRTAARLGTLGLSIALASLIATAVWHLNPVLVVVGWAFAGAGMGILYPRLGVLTLEYSTPEDQGFNSSALSIADATGSAVALATTAVVFAALRGLAGGWPFAGAFAVAAVLCVVAWLLGPRLRARG
ncbi:MFS transporter [Leifsonia sp. fls2-241-R2A-40a]|uniref:MFS transporter n=1 Tax=Leifsonia sp. fls2-241-R2A-40a TaxID=3040290 RepID=UPI00254D43CE|nr:MFS transporter [Leifsonia sp. fls2-241-R2A-40a]